MRDPVYVDLDNLYIINNKVSPKTLLERVSYIMKTYGNTGHKLMFFGNSFTQGILHKYGLLQGSRMKFFVSEIEANSADHNLIFHISRSKSRRVIIITGDMTLCRIAKYVYTKKDVTCMKFSDDHMLHPFEVDFRFARREQLDKFLNSLALYSVRYA